MPGTRTETAPLPVQQPPEGTTQPQPDVPLTIAEPDGSARGGIVVLHEARGVTEDVLWLVRVLADEGWLTVAPHLYHRDTAEPDVEQDTAAERVASLSGATVLADCDGAFAWLARRGIDADRIGVVGFDSGGSVALVVAASRSIGAAVSVAGGGIVERLSDGLPALVEAAPALACPWLGLYGEDDPLIPLEHVEALREAAMRSDVATDVVTYGGVGHRVDVVSDDPGGDDPGGTDALRRVLGWFDSHLR
jgi:carboxymethylenebutenolidase